MNLRDVVDSQVKALKEKSFDELEKLQASHAEKITLGNKKIILTIWKDEISPNEIRIVVQAYYHRFLGIGTSDAVGFKINRSGILLDVEEPEIFEFI